MIRRADTPPPRRRAHFSLTSDEATPPEAFLDSLEQAWPEASTLDHDPDVSRRFAELWARLSALFHLDSDDTMSLTYSELLEGQDFIGELPERMRDTPVVADIIASYKFNDDGLDTFKTALLVLAEWLVFNSIAWKELHDIHRKFVLYSAELQTHIEQAQDDKQPLRDDAEEVLRQAGDRISELETELEQQYAINTELKNTTSATPPAPAAGNATTSQVQRVQAQFARPLPFPTPAPSTTKATASCVPTTGVYHSENYGYTIDPALGKGIHTEKGTLEPGKFSGDRRAFKTWLSSLVFKRRSTKFSSHVMGLRYILTFLDGLVHSMMNARVPTAFPPVQNPFRTIDEMLQHL